MLCNSRSASTDLAVTKPRGRVTGCMSDKDGSEGELILILLWSQARRIEPDVVASARRKTPTCLNRLAIFNSLLRVDVQHAQNTMHKLSRVYGVEGRTAQSKAIFCMLGQKQVARALARFTRVVSSSDGHPTIQKTTVTVTVIRSPLHCVH